MLKQFLPQVWNVDIFSFIVIVIYCYFYLAGGQNCLLQCQRWSKYNFNFTLVIFSLTLRQVNYLIFQLTFVLWIHIKSSWSLIGILLGVNPNKFVRQLVIVGGPLCNNVAHICYPLCEASMYVQPGVPLSLKRVWVHLQYSSWGFR